MNLDPRQPPLQKHRGIPIFAVILLLWLLAPVTAEAGNPEVKTRQDEGLSLEYHLQIENNPRVRYDGQAFVQSIKGNRVYTVLLNRAYFEREAGEIFDRLAKPKEANPVDAEPNQDSGLVAADLLSPGRIPVAELRALQIRLEDAAWQDLYDRSVSAYASARKARREFAKAFARTRLACIEEHEVSHLFDLARGADENNPAFARSSELKAFYAELARGGNPLDTMSQAISGLIDEARRGRTVDFSREKVETVLHLLRQEAGPRGPRVAPTRLNSESLARAGRRLLRPPLPL